MSSRRLSRAKRSNSDLRSASPSGAEAGENTQPDAPTVTCARPQVTAAPVPKTGAVAEGDQIGPYHLMKRIGEGGMGLVFLAAQSEPVTRTVALKIVKAGMDTEEVIRRFEQERQSLAMMDHPGIARVLDAGATDSGRPFFVMELVEGRSITSYCDQQELTTAERIQLFIDVCHAVQHAHLKGIIHRDLKPSNILVHSHDGRHLPKVIDFGIAKAMENRLCLQTALTGVHGFVGTPAYASPEQIEMDGAKIDTRSDVYSLGVILYELLVGTLPFDSKTLEQSTFDELRRLVREKEADRPSTRISTFRGKDAERWAKLRKGMPAELRRQLSGDLDWIVLKALEKDSARRYATASEFAQDLRRHLDHLPVSARPPSTSYLFQKLIRRNRQAFIAAGAAAAALVLGAMGAVWQAVRATAAERVAIEQRDLAYEAQLEAARQARLAHTVSDFLQNDLLLQADSRTQAASGHAQDPNLTVKAALDRAAAGVGDRFATQPLAEAEILHTIGAAYRGIGESVGAVTALERSLELAKKFAGIDHPTTLDAVSQLALAYQESGRALDALPMLEDVLERRRQDSEVREEDELIAIANLALAYTAVGRAEDAITLLQESVERRKTSLGIEHVETLSSMNTLAAAMRDAGRLDEAVQLHREALEIQTRVLGADHPDTLTSTNNLAVALHTIGRLDEARTHYTTALEQMKTTLGEDHPLTLNTQINLSAALRSLGEMEEGIDMLAMAATKRALKLGERHPDTVLTMNSLGVALLSAGQAEDAKPVLEATLQQAAETFGPESEAVFQGERNLALAEAALGATAESAQRIEAALKRAEQSLGRDSPVTLGLAAALVTQLARNDDTDKAMAASKRWLVEMETGLGIGHPDMTECLSAMDECLSNHQRWADSIEIASKLVQARELALGPAHSDVAKARLRLATVLHRTSNHPGAEQALRQALPGLDADDLRVWDGATARSLLAATILADLEITGSFDTGLKQSRLQEAETLLQQAREVFEISAGGGESNPETAEITPPLAETYERLARLCEMTGRDEEASQWRAKANTTVPAKVADSGV